MKILSFFIITLSFGFSFAQRASVKFEVVPNSDNSNEISPRLVEVGSTVKLKAIITGKVEGLKWKIAGEMGKDWKFANKVQSETEALTQDEIEIVFKKMGPTNISLSGKTEIDSLMKGKKAPEKVKITLKCDKKGYLLVTETAEYNELNQLYAEGNVDGYIKLVKKASKMVENEKYAKDPFAYIWLSRGLNKVYGEIDDFTKSKYEPYKNAFNDAISALSKALKYDNNGFLEDPNSKFADFIYEMQYKFYDEIVLVVLSNDTAVQVGKTKTKDYGKLNSTLNKYLKITKNPVCIKHLQVACLFNLKDANAKNLLKDAEADLKKYTDFKDSISFTPVDQLFFAAGITEMMKYYKAKGTSDACDLQKRAIAALPELIQDLEKFEEFINFRDENCDR
jgi:hypothetical protein